MIAGLFRLVGRLLDLVADAIEPHTGQPVTRLADPTPLPGEVDAAWADVQHIFRQSEDDDFNRWGRELWAHRNRKENS